MAYWILSVNISGSGYKIQLPKEWIKRNFSVTDRYVFAKDNGDGTLTLFPEGRWIIERAQKNQYRKDHRT